MRKRQRKKNEKKYLPIYVDEFNLMTMTEEEQEKAWKDYINFREKYAYCKTYRELKDFKKNNKFKMVFYHFPIGKKLSNYFHELNNLVNNHRKK